MIRARNYKTESKFIKVMPRILWPLPPPGHGVNIGIASRNYKYRSGSSNVDTKVSGRRREPRDQE